VDSAVARNSDVSKRRCGSGRMHEPREHPASLIMVVLILVVMMLFVLVVMLFVLMPVMMVMVAIICAALIIVVLGIISPITVIRTIAVISRWR
jgi:uncharacterized membrane protein